VTKNPFSAEVWVVNNVLTPLSSQLERRYGKKATWLFAIAFVWPLARFWFRTRIRIASYFANPPGRDWRNAVAGGTILDDGEDSKEADVSKDTAEEA
jgi:hypothetical protein